MSADTDYDCNYITEEKEAEMIRASREKKVRALIAKHAAGVKRPFLERLTVALSSMFPTRELKAWETRIEEKGASVKADELAALNAFRSYVENFADGEMNNDEYVLATIAQFDANR